MKSCIHIQGQIKSEVTVCQLLSTEASGVSATRAFKSNRIRLITSQSVVRSVKHGISDKYKQLKQERAERAVSEEFVICFSDSVEILAHQE